MSGMRVTGGRGQVRAINGAGAGPLSEPSNPAWYVASERALFGARRWCAQDARASECRPGAPGGGEPDYGECRPSLV